MSKYNRQLIVDGFLLDSEYQRAKFLTDKAKAAMPPLPTETVLFPRAGLPGYEARSRTLRTALRKIDGRSRLYLIGHGDWKSQTLGGVDADTWARTLVDHAFTAAALVSVTGCQAGRDLGTAANWRVKYSADSFASKLHSRLHELGVTVDLYARVHIMRIRSGESEGRRGSKFAEGVYQREESKILFTWQGGRQVRKWVDYLLPDDPDAWVDLDHCVFARNFGSIVA